MEYKLVARKAVTELDGFYTDYSWYEMEDGTHRFVYGDYNLYDPNDDVDWECDNYREAEEWFNNYEGFSDEEIDAYYAMMSWTNIRTSS